MAKRMRERRTSRSREPGREKRSDTCSLEGPLPCNLPGGTSRWRLKHRLSGKARLLSLGSYPGISLEEARAAREKIRQKVRGGVIDHGADRPTAWSASSSIGPPFGPAWRKSTRRGRIAVPALGFGFGPASSAGPGWRCAGSCSFFHFLRFKPDTVVAWERPGVAAQVKNHTDRNPVRKGITRVFRLPRVKPAMVLALDAMNCKRQPVNFFVHGFASMVSRSCSIGGPGRGR